LCRLLSRNYTTYLDRLINQAVEGNAWHADHIIPVYKVCIAVKMAPVVWVLGLILVFSA
jgi:hypothetical protein